MRSSTLRSLKLFAALAIAFICMAALPGIARADSLDMPQVRIAAEVQPNGDLLVRERRDFSFTDDVNGVFWSIPFAENQQGITSSVDIQSVEVEGTASWLGGSTQEFDQADYAENGESGIYTATMQNSALELKVFMPQQDGDEATVRISYVLHGAVMSWADTAELYWKFVGPEWEDASENVTLDVSFAGASAGDAATEDTFRTWGHGSLEGSVTRNEEAAQAHYAVPSVQPGEFAEVRIAFPANWVPQLTASSEARMDTILSEEDTWAAEANARREQARTIATVGTGALVIGSVGLLISAVVLRVTKYKNNKPVFQETYFRDVPSNDHPAVLSALVYDGAVQDCAFVATLMKLTDDHVVELLHETRTEKKFLGGEHEVEDYALKLVNRAGATDAVDRAALDLFFGPSAQDGDVVNFDDMSERDFDDGSNPLEEFQSIVKARLEERGLTNQASAGGKAVVAGMGFLLIIASVIFLIATDGVNLGLVIPSAILAVVAMIVVGTAKVQSQETVELLERCRALKRWLEDFTRLNEAVPDDLILWDKLLVMAVAFGVSEEVLRELADAVPQDRYRDAHGGYFYPSYYWWIYSRGNMGSPMEKMTAAYSATVSELASSSNSSAGGFGGGFSGGGGGGVGGGGGGSF